MVKVGSFSSMFEDPMWKIHVDRENLRVKISSAFHSVCFYIYDSGGYKKLFICICVLYQHDLSL